MPIQAEIKPPSRFLIRAAKPSIAAAPLMPFSFCSSTECQLLFLMKVFDKRLLQ
jgi:hypothetical protein